RAQEPLRIKSVTDAGVMSKMILKAADKKANFLVAEAKVPNAMAVLTNGKRYILYNPGFIERLTNVTGTPWAGISVLAHEIGHHLKTHTENGKTIPMATELEADEFSGYVLRKLGATLEEAQAAMKTLASERATRTHPGRDDRLTSIAEGWEVANSEKGVVALQNPSTVPNGAALETEDRQTTIIDSKFILADIRFDADPTVKYHLTTRYNVVKIKNNELHLVGKLAKLDNKDFPYMIYDESSNRVYVSATGKIVNKEGNSIGKMLRASAL
ncbi:MAG TPA: hypothetical protein VFZ42_00445, partial [Chitinophagaceae bacterium]